MYSIGTFYNLFSMQLTKIVYPLLTLIFEIFMNEYLMYLLFLNGQNKVSLEKQLTLFKIANENKYRNFLLLLLLLFNPRSKEPFCLS